jgi:hypothetical protein
LGAGWDWQGKQCQRACGRRAHVEPTLGAPARLPFYVDSCLLSLLLADSAPDEAALFRHELSCSLYPQLPDLRHDRAGGDASRRGEGLRGNPPTGRRAKASRIFPLPRATPAVGQREGERVFRLRRSLDRSWCTLCAYMPCTVYLYAAIHKVHPLQSIDPVAEVSFGAAPSSCHTRALVQ